MYTAYGIVTLYEWPWWSYSTQVERERVFSLNLCTVQPPLPLIESTLVTYAKAPKSETITNLVFTDFIVKITCL